MVAIRNMGGQVEVSIHDVATLDSEFHFKELVIVHHTDCGVTHMTKDGVAAYLKENLPDVTDAALEAFPIRVFSRFVPFPWLRAPSTGIFRCKVLITILRLSMEESVKHDLEVVRKSPYIRKGLKDSVRGFVFDIKTGLLSPVV